MTNKSLALGGCTLAVSLPRTGGCRLQAVRFGVVADIQSVTESPWGPVLCASLEAQRRRLQV